MALTISASLAQIGEFSFILAGLGTALGLLPAEGRDLILAGAILSILLNPVMFALVDRLRSAEAPSTRPKPDTSAPTGAVPEAPPAAPAPAAPAAEPERDVVPTTLTGHIVVVGYGRVGSLLGAGLLSQGARLLVIEDDRDAIDTARRDGAEVLVGNAADPEVLAAAGLDRAIRLFVAIPGSFEAGQVCQQARSDNATLPIVARAHSDAEVEHLSRCGATLTIMGEAEIARAMLSMCQNLQADRDRPPAASEEPAAAAEAEQPSQVPPPSPPAGASPAA